MAERMTDSPPIFPTAAQFRAWLESKRPRQRVAVDWTYSDCPLARCISEVSKRTVDIIPDAFVWEPWHPTITPSEPLPLPQWAQRFAEAVDKRRAISITALGCLTVLRRVAPEAWGED